MKNQSWKNVKYIYKWLGLTRKLVLGTADGSPKKNLQLLRESMPTPIAYEPGNITVGGVLLEDPRN